MISLLLQEGQTSGQGIVADALLVFIVGIRAQAQGPVVDVASTAKGAGKNSRLPPLLGKIGTGRLASVSCSTVYHLSCEKSTSGSSENEISAAAALLHPA